VTNIWDNFIAVISHLLENAQALLALSQEKRQVLTSTDKADVDALIKITKREEILVLKLNKFEKQRQAVIKEIISSCGLKEEDLANEGAASISQIKKLSGAQYSERIEELGEKLNSCVNGIIALNELNSKLIHQYLDFVEFNVNILSAASCEQTYSSVPQNAAEPQMKRRPLLNAEV